MSIKEQVEIKGKRIEVMVNKTVEGDYIATANFKDGISMAMGRNANKKTARELCIQRLIDHEPQMRKHDEEFRKRLK